MIRPTRICASLVLAAVALTSCGSIPTKDFEVRVINDQNQPVKCLIVVDHAWPSVGETVYYSPATITVPFARKSMNIRVKPAQVGGDGEVARIPRELDPSEYESAGRDVEMRDPKIQLFILKEDPRYGQ